jgi:hypothetical protein
LCFARLTSKCGAIGFCWAVRKSLRITDRNIRGVNGLRFSA